jgi:hypothetical protein
MLFHEMSSKYEYIHSNRQNSVSANGLVFSLLPLPPPLQIRRSILHFPCQAAWSARRRNAGLQFPWFYLKIAAGIFYDVEANFTGYGRFIN